LEGEVCNVDRKRIGVRQGAPAGKGKRGRRSPGGANGTKRNTLRRDLSKNLPVGHRREKKKASDKSKSRKQRYKKKLCPIGTDLQNYRKEGGKEKKANGCSGGGGNSPAEKGEVNRAVGTWRPVKKEKKAQSRREGGHAVTKKGPAV